MNISDDPFSQWVCDLLDISFATTANADLRPTQKVATIAANNTQLQQVNAAWGIKPHWAKKTLINAQAESVAEKPTFRHAFSTYRCIVPCSGFYEWQTLAGGKQKWLFAREDGQPLFMAGILYPTQTNTPQLVTLTTKPNQRFAGYHHRFPQFVHSQDIHSFLTGDADLALKIMMDNDDREIQANTAR
ncbi:SOS response-associated peptidase family protein [Gilvimarinus sp. SDUM040013]|uniref:Abasic site processing protein n=1 Tax=Gilvimarinus gilvus TaxID=3058038 RepID=A0ABU4S1L4_9GAMM|nr:SOS response-associated peptidase family protein [Gilvimarinus sp. SDUM040013]MDO3387819.1 SOS response-associated peptidase family protein [Gilvimarinus sp. SDUM040013]MDX6851038.1 SOS response-associated peptidase family protein [Gilvimarinus sp. SDUM040013]